MPILPSSGISRFPSVSAFRVHLVSQAIPKQSAAHDQREQHADHTDFQEPYDVYATKGPEAFGQAL